MTAVLAPLESLPTATTALLRATLHAQQGLLERSTARLLSLKAPDSVWMVRQSSLSLRFFIARSAAQVLFFFARRDLPEVRPLSAQLDVTVQAVPAPIPTEHAAQPDPDQPIHLLTVPSFLMVKPSAADFAQHAPPSTTEADGILFRFGTQPRCYLGIRHPERGPSAQISYHEEGKPAMVITELPVTPFLSLTETIRSELTADGSAAQTLPIQIPHDPSALSDVYVALFWLIEGFRLMETCSTEQLGDVASPLAQLALSYAPSFYQAELALRVNQQGYFVSDPDADAISLLLRVSVSRERGSLLARLSLLPPDFLCQGTLREAFLRALRQSGSRSLRGQLGLRDEDEWLSFLDSAQERAVIFRVDRTRSADVNVVVLSAAATATTAARQIILRCLAQVDMQQSPPTVTLSDVALRYDSLRGSKQVLDGETLGYFLRLASAFQRWLRLL
jgi:hypothetical protein